MRAMIGLSGARLALRLTPTFEEQCRIPGVPCALAEILEMNRKTISKQVLCFIIEGSSFSFCAVSGAKQTNWNLDPGTAVAKRRKANRGKTCLVLRSERHYGRMQHCSRSKIPNQHQRNSWPPNGILHGCFLPKKLTHPSMGNRILKSFYAAQTVQGNLEQPVTIHLQWSSTPEWRPSVTVNHQSHHDVHGKHGGNPATQTRARECQFR